MSFSLCLLHIHMSMHHLSRCRSMEKEQEQSCQQLEEQQSLLSRAAETEGLLRGQLAEAQVAAAMWQEAVQHGMASGEVWHCSPALLAFCLCSGYSAWSHALHA